MGKLSDPYRNVSIKRDFADEIERFIRTHRNLGYNSIAQFFEDASRRRLEQLQQTVSRSRFEQINFDDNGTKILDRELRRVADVVLKPSSAYCKLDETNNCEHIRFALSLPEVHDIYRKKGWKLPEL